MIQILNKYFVVLPVLYLFFAIFAARDHVQLVYAGAAVLIVLSVLAQYKIKLKPIVLLARWMAILAAIGITASMILSIEKVQLLTEPDRIASCSISPIVACSPVISSPQSSALGFANSFLGIVGFSAVFAAAMTILAGATKLHKAWWRTLLAGIVFGSGFSMWLIHEGVFEIGKLCLYCLLVWIVSFGLLWLVTAYCVEQKYLNFGKKLNELLVHKYELIATTYVIIFMIIVYRWSDYWFSLF